MNNLTPRELQIAHLAAEACTNRQIATLLDCSEQTVKNHLHKAFEKLSAKNRVQLTLILQGRVAA